MMPICSRIDIEECPQTLDPLREQLATMDENERIARPLGNERGGDDRLAERRRRRQYAMVVRRERVERFDLRAAQRALETYPGRKRAAREAMVFQHNFRAVSPDQLDSFVEATPGQTDMARMKFGARNDPWLPEG